MLRIKLGDLRSLIREASAPFAERLTAGHAMDALGALDDADVEGLPSIFKRVAAGARSSRVRQTMQQASGVATHLVHDFKALQALVMVAIKDARRS